MLSFHCLFRQKWWLIVWNIKLNVNSDKIIVLLLCITSNILGHIKTNSILIIYFTTLRSLINISRMNAIHWHVIAWQQLKSFEHKLKCQNLRDIYLIIYSSTLHQNNDSYTILYRVYKVLYTYPASFLNEFFWICCSRVSSELCNISHICSLECDEYKNLCNTGISDECSCKQHKRNE